MEKLTRQDVFELIYINYLNGGANGWDAVKNRCVYFCEKSNGNCAVGVLLKHLGLNVEDLNGQYGNHNSGDILSELLTNCPNVQKIFSELVEKDVFEWQNNGCFLDRLQRAHDVPSQDAYRFGLSLPVSNTNLLYSLRRFAADADISLEFVEQPYKAPQ